MDSTVLIAIVAVFIVSIIFSMFGQGGGSLYTPILFLLGYAALTSISTSLVLNLITALSASIVYYRSNLIDIRFALWFVPGHLPWRIPWRGRSRIHESRDPDVALRDLPYRCRRTDDLHILGEVRARGALPGNIFQRNVCPHHCLQFFCRDRVRPAWCRRRDS